MNPTTKNEETPVQSSLLRVHDLRVTGPAGMLVQGTTLAVGHGETVAIVGESGSGKSMTAKALTGLLPDGVSATGEVDIDGRKLTLDGSGWEGVRGRQIALLPQDPFTSLSPVHRCGDQIGWAVQNRRERAARVSSLLTEVGLATDVARRYPFELSGGMRQRVALAAVLAADPDLLVADEPTTALDVTTQHEVLELLAGLQERRRLGLILITHDLQVARARADRILVMYAGRLMEQGPAGAVLDAPAHPYTARLAACDPPLTHRVEPLPMIPGSVPQPYTVQGHCAFADRCDLVVDACRSAEPVLIEVGPGRSSSCLLTEQVRPPVTDLPPSAGSGAAPTSSPTASQARPVLAVRGLTKRFRPDGRPAVDGVDLTVAGGEVLAVVGESGSGKTTLARCVAGLEKADTGTIDFGDEPAGPARVQVVFQDPYSALNPGLSIGTQLEEALRVAGQDRTAVTELLEMVGLPAGYARRRPRALSGGERQRVALARALAPRPRLLVCDEPVSALDVSVQAGVLNLIAELRRELGLTVLFITHDLAVARQSADRICVMYHGQVVESGPADTVLSAPGHDYTRRLLGSVPATRS